MIKSCFDSIVGWFDKPDTYSSINNNTPAALMFLAWKGGTGRSILSVMTRWLTSAYLFDLSPQEDSSMSAMEMEGTNHVFFGKASVPPIFKAAGLSLEEFKSIVEPKLGVANVVIDCPIPGLGPQEDELMAYLLQIKNMKVLVPVLLGPRLTGTLDRTERLLKAAKVDNPTLDGRVVINSVIGDDGEPGSFYPIQVLAEAINEVLGSSLPLAGVVRWCEGFGNLDKAALDSNAGKDLASVLHAIGMPLDNSTAYRGM